MFTNLFAIQLNHVLNLLTSFDLLFVLQSFFRLMRVNEKIPIESDPIDFMISGAAIARSRLVLQPVTIPVAIVED